MYEKQRNKNTKQREAAAKLKQEDPVGYRAYLDGKNFSRNFLKQNDLPAYFDYVDRTLSNRSQSRQENRPRWIVKDLNQMIAQRV